MLLDAGLPQATLQSIPSIAKAAEKTGFACLWISETQHDPFLPGVLIAEHTRHMQFGNAVAISFARSPATIAYTAWDLAQASQGRFILGLGTQVRAHIERRFGMSWPDSPVKKLREQIAAIRSYWKTWQTGAALNFRGEYYKLSLMTPFFNPGPIDHPSIPIYIAGVNTALARLAGEAADGFHVHPLNTPAYLKSVLLPAIQQGAKRSSRSTDQVIISATAFVATNPQEEEFTRQQIAFYASTPSYRSLMAFHGWEEIALKLSGLAARGRWSEMPALINQEILSTIATIAPPGELASELCQRYQGMVDRLTIYYPFFPGDREEFWSILVNEWHKLN